MRCAALPGVIALTGLLALCGSGCRLLAQELPDHATTAPGPMLAHGVETFDTPDFTLSLVRSPQTIAALKPKGAAGFDFTPGDLLAQRSRDGYYHLGDLDLRLRSGTSGPWRSYSTALARRPVTALSAAAGELAAADLAPSLPADIPLQIMRSWKVEDGKSTTVMLTTSH